jgi:hypothetical protein
MHNIALSALFPMRPIAPVIHTPKYYHACTARTQTCITTLAQSKRHSLFCFTLFSPRGNVAYHKRIATTPLESRLGTSDLAPPPPWNGTPDDWNLASVACRASRSPFFALMATRGCALPTPPPLSSEPCVRESRDPAAQETDGDRGPRSLPDVPRSKGAPHYLEVAI